MAQHFDFHKLAELLRIIINEQKQLAGRIDIFESDREASGELSAFPFVGVNNCLMPGMPYVVKVTSIASGHFWGTPVEFTDTAVKWTSDSSLSPFRVEMSGGTGCPHVGRFCAVFPGGFASDGSEAYYGTFPSHHWKFGQMAGALSPGGSATAYLVVRNANDNGWTTGGGTLTVYSPPLQTSSTTIAAGSYVKIEYHDDPLFPHPVVTASQCSST